MNAAESEKVKQLQAKHRELMLEADLIAAEISRTLMTATPYTGRRNNSPRSRQQTRAPARP